MQTLYGEINDFDYQRFSKLSGNKIVNGQWVLVSEELDYWQLDSPSSSSEDRRWKKKRGWLPVRDLNFQYAHLKSNGDVYKAMTLAEEKLFDKNGKPVYLPEELSYRVEAELTGKPKSYPKILEEVKKAA